MKFLLLNWNIWEIFLQHIVGFTYCLDGFFLVFTYLKKQGQNHLFFFEMVTMMLINGDCLTEMDKLIGGGAKSGFNFN